MAYQVLARKYRPQRFSDVAGQDHVTRTLLNALSQNRIAHGYIFSGHRGIGKTTIARILAMALNCRRAIGSPERPSPEPCETCESCTEIRAGNAVDVIEIDAATNRGIDEIRELRDAARYQPARDRYKIYILDEAHQITDAAFNALLKTLEEPPDHVIFMMATTQPEDIPQTIRSRSQHFSFHAVSFEDILAELRAIAQKENVLADDTALSLLAEAGDGSMRDALSIMDQAIASAPLADGAARLDADQIRSLMGTMPNTVFEKFLELISENNSAAIMEEANTLLNAGNSASQIARQFVRYLRNCLMARLGGENTALLEISADERARSYRSSVLFSEEDLTRFLQVMLRTFDELNYRQEPRFHLELGLMKLVHLQRLLPVEELLSQLGGKTVPAQRTTPAPAARPASLTPPRQAGPVASRPAAAPAAPAPTERSISPFEADRSRKRGSEPVASITAAPAVDLPQPSTHAISPFTSVTAIAEAEPEPPPVTGVIQPMEEPTPASAPGDQLNTLRDAIVRALDDQGHHTAAALLAAAIWRESAGAIEVEVAARKVMLGLVMSPEADRIARATLKTHGVTARFNVLPGEAPANGAQDSRPAPQGSIQAQALDNPLVKQAQELFRAEVRSVLDLRDKH